MTMKQLAPFPIALALLALGNITEPATRAKMPNIYVWLFSYWKNTEINTYELEREKAPVQYILLLLKNCIIGYRGLNLIKHLGAGFFIILQLFA